ERELSAPNYTPRTIAIGTNTDPYQPIERRYEIMRQILEVLERAGHPVGIVTKSTLVLRDSEILARMAKRNLVQVGSSVTTLVREMRGGKDYDSTWGQRMKGSGPYAWMIGRRFEVACEKLGLNEERVKLTTEHFRPPRPSAVQLDLF